MSAYIIARIEVTDMEQYKKYIALTPDIIAQFGGKFIARGGQTATLEGPEESGRVVIVEFPTYDQAVAFYNSDEYQAAIKVRENAATASFVVVGGA